MTINRVLVTGGSGFIGTNLVDLYLDKGVDVANLDIRPPRNNAHLEYWNQVDICNYPAVLQLVEKVRPDVIFHMAARTDLQGEDLQEYNANTIGVQNLIDAGKRVHGLERIVFASSMLVNKLGCIPDNELDCNPGTKYGESKVLGESLVRAEDLTQLPWTIVRPTSIWGPWFDIPYRTFFTMVERGLYLHPKQTNVRRSYGFVHNIVFELDRLARAAPEDVAGKTFYLADYEPLEIREWAEVISGALDAPRIREAPVVLLRALARLGDFLQGIGIRNFPISSFRLSNMQTNAVFDLRDLERICGPLPYSMRDGVDITADWIREKK